MTQNTQTTAERVRDMAVSQIAAEIDALTAERDKAQAEVERLTREVNRVIDERESVTTIGLAMQERAQVAEAEAERLRPAAEAWETAEVANAANANRMSLIMDAAAYLSAKADWVVAQEKADAARARAAKERKP